jgi:hypothetical protein
VDCFLAMPDHWHALIAFPEQEQMERVLRDWKHYVARQSGIVWQDGFFDHRLRSAKKANETWHYIEQNPVRKGLCVAPEDWPWKWRATEIATGLAGRARCPQRAGSGEIDRPQVGITLSEPKSYRRPVGAQLFFEDNSSP